MEDSNCSFEAITRPNGQGGTRIVGVRFTATIYINRPDTLSLFEFLATVPRDIVLHLGGYDNITGSGSGTIGVPNVSIVIGLETANKFLKIGVKLGAVIADIHSVVTVV